MNKLFFLIGASGSGKTTIIKIIEKKKLDNLQICYFDSVGVPSTEEMIKNYGSAEEWQKVKTIEWTQKIKKNFLSAKTVVLDGQTRPSFIEKACKENNVINYEIILFDCSDDIRKSRLTARGHPELADDRMMNWAKHLREDCDLRRIKIIDTSNLPIDECASELIGIVGRN